MNHTDRIFPTNRGLTTYLDELLAKNYQIPTFQREVVWEKENVKKLWDSIYKFYPLGSILIWKTDLKLQNHRDIGGHKISNGNSNRTEYQYILDGQQRTTSLLTSLYGGEISGQNSFNPTLYVDLSVEMTSEVDDDSYKRRFLFWDEIDDRGGSLLPNVGKSKRFSEGIIVKLNDIKLDFENTQGRIVNHGSVKQDYNHPYWRELRKIKQVLDNYRISFIEVKGIQVAEVCQIFERINQAGKPLNIFDIVVAKTFRPVTKEDPGFYLRELIDSFRSTNQSNFLGISELDYLQILAVLINKHVIGSGVHNITDRYLNEIKTEHIESIWVDAKSAILKTFDFFENHLHIRSPHLIPFRYLYMTISSYLYKNDSPDYGMLKQYFWYHSFHNDDLLSNTTQLFQHLESLSEYRNSGKQIFDRLVIDRSKLRNATYSSKGRWSRAVLSLLANQKPRDWEYCDREVLVHNFFFSTDKPNLHHVFPTNSDYVLSNKHKIKVTSDSLMNIVYLTQMTNLNITNRNPLEYINDYDKPAFNSVMPTHMLPPQILQWAREGNMPDDAIDQFIEARVEMVIEELRNKLPTIQVEVIDTSAFDSLLSIGFEN